MRLPAVVLSGGYFGIRLKYDNKVWPISDLKITDAYIDDNDKPVFDGVCGYGVVFDAQEPRPGNTYLLWHEGTWYFEIMDEFHPKTFKTEGISALRISGPDLREEFERLHAQETGN